jgi:hypothetical protein
MERFFQFIPESLRATSGKVFYSGRTAFSSPSPLYILGINPGGHPEEHASETVESDKRYALEQKHDWSAYRDESWEGKRPGEHGMQPRVLHMLRSLNLEPGRVPASNLVFERSAKEADIKASLGDLAELCWPFHRAVIQDLGVRVVVCFGKLCGQWVCRQSRRSPGCG